MIFLTWKSPRLSVFVALEMSEEKSSCIARLIASQHLPRIVNIDSNVNRNAVRIDGAFRRCSDTKKEDEEEEKRSAY